MADGEPGSIAQREDAGDAWRSSTVAESSLAGIATDSHMSASARLPIADYCGRPRSYRSGLEGTAMFWMEYGGRTPPGRVSEIPAGEGHGENFLTRVLPTEGDTVFTSKKHIRERLQGTMR